MRDQEKAMVYTINDLTEKLKISKSMAYQIARNQDFPKVRITFIYHFIIYHLLI